MITISNFLFNFSNFCVIISFLTKLLTLGVLFSTAIRTLVVANLKILGILSLTSFILRAVLVAKLVIIGLSPLISFHLASRGALVSKLLISGILSSISFYLSIICIFFIHLHFLLHLLVYRNNRNGY